MYHGVAPEKPVRPDIVVISEFTGAPKKMKTRTPEHKTNKRTIFTSILLTMLIFILPSAFAVAILKLVSVFAGGVAPSTKFVAMLLALFVTLILMLGRVREP